jgi:hypothetical protein
MESIATTLSGVKGLTSSMSEADELLEADLEPRLNAIEDALATARSEVAETQSVLRRAATLLVAAPSLFGDSTDRRYLLLLQNPSQSRATGGLIEYYGVLEVSEGRFELNRVSPISRLDDGSGDWSSINESADFPAVARAVLSLFRQQTGRRLDGVIATDPLALEQMTRATGPVRERGYDVAISSENAAQVLMHDIFEHFEGEKSARDRYTSAVVGQVFGAITEGIGDSSILLDAFRSSAEAQHLKLYSTHKDDQRALDDLELSGDPRLLGPDALVVTQNSRVASKVDFFLRREIEILAELRKDGSARVTNTAIVENRAPAGPPSQVLGFDGPGIARLSLEALLPESARNIQYEGGGGKNPRVFSGLDERRVFAVNLNIPPGSRRGVSFSYETVSPPRIEEGREFELVLLPQALAFPELATVSIAAPGGFCVNSCDRPSSATWEATRTLEDPWRVRVTVRQFRTLD